MTMVRRGHELTHAQARGLVVKKNKVGPTAGPRLAKGRPENLMRSRSCTPSDDEVVSSDDDDDEEEGMRHEQQQQQQQQQERFNFSASVPSAVANRPSDSPASEQLSSLASFSPSFPTPSTSQASLYTSASPRHLEDAPTRPPPLRRELSPLAEEPSDRSAVLAGLTRRDGPSWSYPDRLNELQTSSSIDAELPTTIPTSPRPIFASTTAINPRRSCEVALRPLAKRPAGQRHSSEEQILHEQVNRTAAGKKKGIKKPYGNPEKREKVKKVRAHGACLRCQIMRQACEVTEENRPCTNCRVLRRKFNLPCTRLGPAKRVKYLFPNLLIGRLNHALLPCIEGHEREDAFSLPLTHVSGFSLQMQVVEAPESRLPPAGNIKPYFAEKGDGYDTVSTLTTELSIPLVPVISSSFKDAAEWLAMQVGETLNERWPDLPRKVFPDDKGQLWARSVLQLVGEFHDRVYSSPRIRKILKTVVVRHLMSRRFYIPFDQMTEVNEKLTERYRETEADLEERRETERCWVPKFVNRYLKAALMRLLHDSLVVDFETLEEMFKLHEKSPGGEITDLDRDEAFCFVATILIIVSIMQIKILEVAKSRDAEASHNCPFGSQTNHLTQAKPLIQQVEDEVVNHILGLWVYKFIKCNRKGKPDPTLQLSAQRAEEWDVVDRFHKTMLQHADHLEPYYQDLELKLDDTRQQEWFCVHNTTRVLLLFAGTLTPPASSSKSKKVQQTR